MAEAAAATTSRMSSNVSALGRLNLLTAPETMDTSQRNYSISSGRGSMGTPSKGQRRWLKRQEKEEAKKVRTAEDEKEFPVTVVAREMVARNRGIQMEMSSGTTLRKVEQRTGGRRSGTQPELGAGEEQWGKAA